MVEIERLAVPIEEAAVMLSVSRRTIERRVQEGKLRLTEDGKVSMESLRQYAAGETKDKKGK